MSAEMRAWPFIRIRAQDSDHHNGRRSEWVDMNLAGRSVGASSAALMNRNCL